MKIEFNHSNLAPDYNNDSFVIRMEILRILDKIKQQIDAGETYGPVIDINGNKVGNWSID